MSSTRPFLPQIGLARVSGASMIPTLRAGDRLLVLHGARPRTGDVVVVRLPPTAHGPRPLAVKRLDHVLPDGSWWVTSDGVGTDSTELGALPAGALLAVAVLRLPARGRRLSWLRPRR